MEFIGIGLTAWTAIIVILAMVILSAMMFVLGKEKMHSIWGIFCLFVTLWISAFYGAILTKDPQMAELWWKASYVGVIFMPFVFFHFILEFTKINFTKKSLLIKGLYAAALILSVLNLTANVIVDGVEFSFGEFYYGQPGIFHPYFFIIYLFFVSFSFYLVYRKYNKEKTNFEFRRRAIYFFIANLVAFGGGSLNFLPIYGIEIHPATNISVAVGAAILTYSILRHRLFDARVVTAQLLTLILIAYGLGRLIVSGSVQEAIFNVLILLLTLGVGIFLMRSVSKEVEQREQLQSLTGQLRQANADLLLRNRYLSALQELTNEITRSLDFSKVTQNIVDGIASKLGFVGGLLMLRDEQDGNTIRMAAITHSRLISRALKYLPKSLSEYKGNYKIDNDLAVLAMRTRRVQIGTDLRSFLGPTIPKGITAIIQSLLRIRSVLAVPITAKDSVVGCLVVVSRKPKKDITSTEIQMIQALADEVGIVTTNVQLYEQLETVNQKLVVANHELARLDKAKTEFLSIASHQLRTPLTAIKGYLSMVIEGDYGKLPEKMKEPIKDVYESSERLIALVNDLLDVSRIASGRLELHIEKVDLSEMTRAVIEEIRPKAESKHLNLFVDVIAKDEITVLADSEKLRQVVINLIDNAIKYTPKGDVVISIEKRGEILRYSVSDHGIGISKEELPQLFHRFARTKEAKLVQTEGTGLGLYVARTIIEAMKGRIWAESDGLGKGSKFIFELPAADSPQAIKQEVLKVPPKQPTTYN